jgi:hypothetical protein
MNKSNFQTMNRILFFISIVMLLFSFNSQAQSTANPDTVCAGSNVYYKIPSPTAGSTFTWGIYKSGGSIQTTAQSDSIRVVWENTAGTDSLWVFETNAAGCKGDTAKLTVVRVASPTAEFDNATLCYGETLNVTFTGFPPFAIEYTLDGNTVTQSGITQNPYPVVGTAGNYVLTQVSDRHCINNTLTGTINAIIGQPLNILQIIHD